MTKIIINHFSNSNSQYFNIEMTDYALKIPLFFLFRNRLQRERERDITDKIALGLPNTGGNRDEIQYDQRLFNQSKVCMLIYTINCPVSLLFSV